MRNILFIIITITSFSLNAQVSGFKGKRNVVEIGTEIGVNWGSSLFGGGGLDENEKISLPIAIQYERAIKRHAGLRFAMSWTRCQFGTEIFSTNKTILNNGSTYDFTIGYIRYMSSWGLAPIGRYIAIEGGPQILTAKSGDIAGKTISANGVNAILSLSSGKRMIIAGNVSVDYGYRFITSLGYSAFLGGIPLFMKGSAATYIDATGAEFEPSYKDTLIPRTSLLTGFNSGIQVYARFGLVH